MSSVSLANPILWSEESIIEKASSFIKDENKKVTDTYSQFKKAEKMQLHSRFLCNKLQNSIKISIYKVTKLHEAALSALAIRNYTNPAAYEIPVLGAKKVEVLSSIVEFANAVITDSKRTLDLIESAKPTCPLFTPMQRSAFWKIAGLISVLAATYFGYKSYANAPSTEYYNLKNVYNSCHSNRARIVLCEQGLLKEKIEIDNSKSSLHPLIIENYIACLKKTGVNINDLMPLTSINLGLDVNNDDHPNPKVDCRKQKNDLLAYEYDNIRNYDKNFV